jgi:hypothetical protein
MNKRYLLVVLLLGVAIGSIATHYFAPNPQFPRFSQAVIPDMPEVADVSVAEAESLRTERYEGISTIEEVLALPTDFAETEALYIIAGRSNSGDVQNLIHQAAQVRSRTDRLAALRILFLRLTELDPMSALAISRTPSFVTDKNHEKSVWVAWGRLDLAAAVDEAQKGTPAEKRLAAQALYSAVRGLENSDSELIYSELGIKPGQNVRAQHLYALAEQSPADAIRYIESLSSPAEQHKQFGWLAGLLARSGDELDESYADLIQSTTNRQQFKQLLSMHGARSDPLAVLEKMSTLSMTQENQMQVASALQTLAAEDPARALEYLEQMPESSSLQRTKSSIATLVARSDPTMALAWARDNDTSSDQSTLMAVLSQVAQQDPQLALAEAQSLKDIRQQDQLVSTVAMHISQTKPEEAMQLLSQVTNRRIRDRTASQIAAVWAQSDFDGAVNWVSSLDLDAQRSALQSMGQNLVHTDLDRAIELLERFPGKNSGRLAIQITQSLAEAKSTDAAMSFANRYRDKPEYSELQSIVIGMTAISNPSLAMQMARDVENDSSRDQLYARIIGQQAARDPQQALQWMNSISGEKSRSAATAQIAMQWYSQDPAAASAWVSGLPQGSTRDDAIVATISSGRGSDDDFLDLIDTVSDPAKRKQATLMQIQLFIQSDPAEAERLLGEADLTDEERERYESMLRGYGYGY